MPGPTDLVSNSVNSLVSRVSKFILRSRMLFACIASASLPVAKRLPLSSTIATRDGSNSGTADATKCCIAAILSPALTGPDGITPQALEDFDDLIDIESMDSRVKASALKQISDIIENEPEQALSIIRSWMYAET